MKTLKFHTHEAILSITTIAIDHCLRLKQLDNTGWNGNDKS